MISGTCNTEECDEGGPNLCVYSDPLGLAVDYTGGAVVNAECRGYPESERLLNRWLSDQMPEDLGAQLVLTSISINKNYAGALHRDGNNVGPSSIKAFGDFQGGELRYGYEDDKICNAETIEEKKTRNVNA